MPSGVFVCSQKGDLEEIRFAVRQIQLQAVCSVHHVESCPLLAETSTPRGFTEDNALDISGRNDTLAVVFPKMIINGR